MMVLTTEHSLPIFQRKDASWRYARRHGGMGGTEEWIIKSKLLILNQKSLERGFLIYNVCMKAGIDYIGVSVEHSFLMMRGRLM